MQVSEPLRHSISPSDLCLLCKEDGSAPVLLDVRTPAEFEDAHIEGARLAPLDSLDAKALARELGDRPVHVICQSGNRARQAIDKLEQAGHSQSILLDGGMSGWLAADLPAIRGHKTMSLERQVRIAAGAIVVLGAVLGWTFGNPALHGISAFVGAGLVFAGITDTCGMGMLIAKMPWNRVRKSA